MEKIKKFLLDNYKIMIPIIFMFLLFVAFLIYYKVSISSQYHIDKEEDVFQYGSNSRSAPDFEEAGIELKVTPYKKNKNGTLSAKERLVLNIINYMKEYKNTFYTT